MANSNPNQNVQNQQPSTQQGNRAGQPRDGEGRFVDERQTRGSDGKNMDTRNPGSSDKQRSDSSSNPGRDSSNPGRDDSARNR